MGFIKNTKAKLDAKLTVQNALRETKRELAHIDKIAGLINEGLSALHDLEGSTVTFNKYARNSGDTDVRFSIDPPKGAEIDDKDFYRRNGTHISVGNESIWLSAHASSIHGGGDFIPSTPEGVKTVLDKASRAAVLYNQIP